jgi:hypothetical protein
MSDRTTATVATDQISPTNKKAGGGGANKRHSIVEKLRTELEQNPTRPLDDLPTLLGPVVDSEFPTEEKMPRSRDVDDAVNRFPDAFDPEATPAHGSPCWYEVGQWIERYHTDMMWHLEPIRRIVIEEDINPVTGDPEYTYYYKTSAGILVPHERARAPEEGLKRAFGTRPWIWQQWALVKLEQYVRFQDQHERDFMQVDFAILPQQLWDSWLNDPRNHEFKTLYDSKTESAQKKLVDHVMKPFFLMNHICNDKEEWNVEEADFTVYQYAGIFGSGFITTLLCMFIQFTVPILLLIFQVRVSSRFHGEVEVDTDTQNLTWIFNSDIDEFCNQSGAFDSLLMNLVVFFVYSMRVVPQVADQIYKVLGDQDTLESKVNSLRIGIWNQGDDNIYQQIGMKMDRYMNTVYVVVVNLLMLIVLFLTDSTVDIILNALAIDFVLAFDEEIAGAKWYDGDRRYIRAGILELVFCVELRLEWLLLPEQFIPNLGCDDYMEKVGGPLYDEQIATVDRNDPKYMTVEDKIWHAAMMYANTTGKKEALWQYREDVAVFGWGDYLAYHLGILNTGIFNRYTNYCVWSRWDKVLFLATVPKIGKMEIENGKLICTEVSDWRELPSNKNKAMQAKTDSQSQSNSAGKIKGVTSSLVGVIAQTPAKLPLLNYDPASSWKSAARFAREYSRLLRFKLGMDAIKCVWRRKQYHYLLFRVPDAILELIFMWIIVFFPVGLVLYLFIVLQCQPIA